MFNCIFFGISESKKSMLSIIILSLWSCAFFIQIAVDMQLYVILTVLFSFSFFWGWGGGGLQFVGMFFMLLS